MLLLVVMGASPPSASTRLGRHPHDVLCLLSKPFVLLKPIPTLFPALEHSSEKVPTAPVVSFYSP